MVLLLCLLQDKHSLQFTSSGTRELLQYFEQFVIGYFFPGINITAGMSNHKSAYLMFYMVKVVNFTQASAHWLMKFT